MLLAMLPPDVEIAQEAHEDAAAIAALHAAAFGPGRFARTAYRLREGVAPTAALSFVARSRASLVGSVRQTRIRIGAADALLLGPLAVAPPLVGLGIGRTLLGTAVEAARAAGESLILLVGDPPYYAPYGFIPVTPAGRIRLPGPVDPSRVLIAGLAPGAAETACGPAQRWHG